MNFKIYRDGDARFRLRKVVIELYDVNGYLLDRRRMFAGPFFSFRVKLKQLRMVKLGKMITAYSSFNLK